MTFDPRLNKLTELKVRSAKEPGLYGDGSGLWLQVNGNSKSWLLRYMIDGRARYMGLGAYPAFSLKEARERARRARQLVIDRIDPIEARNQERAQKKLEVAKAITFEQACERYVALHEGDWKNGKHAAQWRSTLATTYPVIGDLPVAAIDTGLVLKVLEPMWKVTPETASRLRGRIERVLAWATISGYRSGDNPARWSGHLVEALPKLNRSSVEHHAALPFDELPAFMVELREREGISARALEFAILTAARTGEAVGARWDEIDLTKKTWTIPGERMKIGKEHRVPLSARAIEILQALPREDGNPHVFVGARNEAVGRTTMLKLLKAMRPGFVPHGFRSTFRDWASERTSFPPQVVEMALAHAIGNKVEAAYRRGDLLAKRAALMNAWASFCTTPASGKVVPFGKKANVS
jgi:integrase